MSFGASKRFTDLMPLSPNYPEISQTITTKMAGIGSESEQYKVKTSEREQGLQNQRRRYAKT